MIGMHPSQSMRWCSEAAQVLEPEVADHPPPFGIGLEKLSCPPFYTLIFEKKKLCFHLCIQIFKTPTMIQSFKLRTSNLNLHFSFFLGGGGSWGKCGWLSHGVLEDGDDGFGNLGDDDDLGSDDMPVDSDVD